MRISMRADYGARAMIQLAMRYGDGLTQTAEIASRQHIPESYLEQLLTTLRKAGLIRSLRGPSGGHELARPPADITLGEVFDVLEGVGPLLGASNGNLSSVAVLQDIWRELADAYHRILHGISIEELVRRQADRESRTMYYI